MAMLRKFSWKGRSDTQPLPNHTDKDSPESGFKRRVNRSMSLMERPSSHDDVQRNFSLSQSVTPTPALHCGVPAGAKVNVFAYTYDPTIAWDLLKDRQPVKTVKPMKLDSPMKDEFVRFVCLSDIHGKRLKADSIPDGDVLIVAGDFTTCGHPDEIKFFNRFLGTLPHRYKLLIAGNHELTFDPILKKSNYMGFERIFKNFDSQDAQQRQAINVALEAEHITDVRSLLTNCTYLEDCEVVLYGIRIYGTPWQPAFDNWAFNLPRGQACLDKWNLVPQGIDVLITHTPPLGHGDLTRTGVRAGCVELLNSVRKRIRPKYHIFGHIHEGYGCTSDGYTKFLNVCTCDEFGKASNPPIIFDFPIPNGHEK